MVIEHRATHTLYRCDCCAGKYQGMPPKPGQIRPKDYCRLCAQAWVRFCCVLLSGTITVKGPR